MKRIVIAFISLIIISQITWGQNNGLDFANVANNPKKAERVTIDSMDNSNYSGITLEAWCRLNSYYDTTGSFASGSFIFCKQSNPASNDQFGNVLVILSEDNQDGDYRRIGFGMNFGTGGETHIGLHSNSEVPLHEWHHIAAVWDGDSMKVYLDGYWDGSVDVSTLGTYYEPAGTPFYLGYRNYYLRTIYDGMIDEARIWSYAKTQAQVQADMYKELSGSETGLEAYWSLNSSSGQTVTDNSGNGNDGYLGNSASDTKYDPSWAASTAPLPYYSVQNGSWATNASWASYQNTPDEPWAVVDIKDSITSSTSISIDSLTIYPGASLTVNSGSSLNVSGSNGLLIQADATGMGSLINFNSGVQATAQLYLSADYWHYLSPAVSGSLSGAFSGLYLRTFDENSYSWNPYITSLTTGLSPLTGYACWSSSTAATVDLTGTLSVGTKSMTVTNNASLTNPGWNLVGNPFPSSLDWDAVSGWDKTHVDNTLYYYSGVDSSYHYYVGTGGSTPSAGINDGTNEIPPMQGFFVKATSTGTFSVGDAARIHSSQAFYKYSDASNSLVPMIRMQISKDNNSDETIIRFVEDATESQDGQFDAWKLFSANHPQIYSTTINGEDLAVNSLPGFSENRTVALGIYVPTSGTYEIKATELADFQQGVHVFLEDHLSGDMQELSLNSSFETELSPNDDPHRFLLHFQKTNSVNSQTNQANIQIYSWGKTIYVIDPSPEKGKIVVFDLQGRKVKNMDSNANGFTNFTLSSNQGGYFLIQYSSNRQVMNSKVFVQ